MCMQRGSKPVVNSNRLVGVSFQVVPIAPGLSLSLSLPLSLSFSEKRKGSKPVVHLKMTRGGLATT